MTCVSLCRDLTTKNWEKNGKWVSRLGIQVIIRKTRDTQKSRTLVNDVSHLSPRKGVLDFEFGIFPTETRRVQLQGSYFNI